MTDRVARLLELYQLLAIAYVPSYRAEQMRLLSEMSDKESTDYYRSIAQYRTTHPVPEELIEWPG